MGEVSMILHFAQRPRGHPGPDRAWAKRSARKGAQEPTQTVISYFKGQPDEWQTGLPTYARLVYPDLWPGIDLVYYGTVDQLKGVEGDLLQLRRRISD